MTKPPLLSRCGLLCNYCSSYTGEDKEHPCPGCLAAGGKPWWGDCKAYQCMTDHKVHHCGLCGDFPCDFFVTHYDPDNPEGQRNAVIRTGILSYRAKHGNDKTIELLQKLKKS